MNETWNIWIDASNAAFEDEPATEIARILRHPPALSGRVPCAGILCLYSTPTATDAAPWSWGTSMTPYPLLRALLPRTCPPDTWRPVGPYDLLLRKNGSIDLRRKVQTRHGWRYRVDRVSKRGITYFQGFRPLED